MLHTPTLAPALGHLPVLLGSVVRLGTTQDAGSESPACPFIAFPCVLGPWVLRAGALVPLGRGENPADRRAQAADVSPSRRAAQSARGPECR